MAQIDVNDEWTPLDDLVSVHTADDAAELHRRLLCFPDRGGNKADAFEPWCLFHKVHADDPTGAVVTALLLLTDRRWRHATGRLVRRIEESGLVPDDQLDLLAQTSLAADDQVYWEAPANWFGGPAIVLDTDESAGDVIEDEASGDPDDRPVLFAREVRPPLRRWAAGRAVRSAPSCWGALVQRAREVDPRAGAAIVHGLLDGIDLLAPPAREFMLYLAENWPHRKVREAAATLRNPPEPVRAAATGATAVPGAPTPSAAQASLF